MPPKLDIDATVDGIVEDILPQPDPVDPPEPDLDAKEPDEEVVEVKDPIVDPEEPKPELKEGDDGYVAPEIVDAPKSWSKEIAPEFTKLAKPVQEYIRKREEDFTNGISQYKQAADYGNAVHAVIQPYMAHLNSKGADVSNTLKFLLNADYLLATGTPERKSAFIRQVMKDSGITTEMLGAEPQQKSADVEALERQITEMGGTLNQFQTAQLNERQQVIAKAVDTFAADPKNIYFKELSADIVKLIGVGYTLEDAYEKAMWANPATRAKEQVRSSKEKDEATKKAATEAALKAKKATRQNVKDTPSSRNAPTGLLGSMDDTLRSTLRNIHERQS